MISISHNLNIFNSISNFNPLGFTPKQSSHLQWDDLQTISEMAWLNL